MSVTVVFACRLNRVIILSEDYIVSSIISQLHMFFFYVTSMSIPRFPQLHVYMFIRHCDTV